MPPYWGVEALKALAVAARTFAIRKLGQGGDFDLRASESDQAYSALTDQREESNAAVDGTRGQVLSSQGQLVTAFYMAPDGAHTASRDFRSVGWDHASRLRPHHG